MNLRPDRRGNRWAAALVKFGPINTEKPLRTKGKLLWADRIAATLLSSSWNESAFGPFADPFRYGGFRRPEPFRQFILRPEPLAQSKVG
jgi:hypothetical protein